MSTGYVERIHRPRDRRVPFNPFDARMATAEDGHRAGPACGLCPRWRCPGCLLLRPWCFGCGDDQPCLCDDCRAGTGETQRSTQEKTRSET